MRSFLAQITLCVVCVHMTLRIEREQYNIKEASKTPDHPQNRYLYTILDNVTACVFRDHPQLDYYWFLYHVRALTKLSPFNFSELRIIFLSHADHLEHVVGGSTIDASISLSIIQLMIYYIGIVIIMCTVIQ